MIEKSFFIISLNINLRLFGVMGGRIVGLNLWAIPQQAAACKSQAALDRGLVAAPLHRAFAMKMTGSGLARSRFV
jgi:hypothetical protein